MLCLGLSYLLIHPIVSWLLVIPVTRILETTFAVKEPQNHLELTPAIRIAGIEWNKVVARTHVIEISID